MQLNSWWISKFPITNKEKESFDCIINFLGFKCVSFHKYWQLRAAGSSCYGISFQLLLLVFVLVLVSVVGFQQGSTTTAKRSWVSAWTWMAALGLIKNGTVLCSASINKSHRCAFVHVGCACIRQNMMRLREYQLIADWSNIRLRRLSSTP